MNNQQLKATQGMRISTKIDLALAGLFCCLLIASALYQFHSQRQTVEALVVEQANVIADSYFDNINTLMLTGQMSRQQIARDKAVSNEAVLDARILRGDAVKKLYGNGLDSAQPQDNLDQAALAGSAQQQLSRNEQGRVLTVITPLPASESYKGTNCMTCHPAKAGEILGAVRVDYSLAKFDRQIHEQLLTSVALNSLLLIIGWALIRLALKQMIVRPLRQISGTIQNIHASANLDLKIELQSSDELGTVANCFNEMIAKFGSIILQLNQLANHLSQQADALQNSAQQSLSETQRLNRETDQVSVAMTQMDQTSLTVAENISEAANTTGQVEQQSQHGQQTVSTAINGIQSLAQELQKTDDMTSQLQQHSEQVIQIVDVITNIAEQTNLLALNAAIEAARAGEQGRGFAVVADEVRALASRTGESTIEIRTMIEALQDQVRHTRQAVADSSELAQHSVSQSGTTGDVLARITQAISSISLLNSQSATAAEEQHHVAAEINKNVLAINDICHHSEANAENLAQASSQLSQLADQLNTMIAQFKVNPG